MGILAPITLGRRFLYNDALVMTITERHRRICAIRVVGVLGVLSILSVAGCSSTRPLARQASYAAAKSLALTSLRATPQQRPVKPAPPASTGLVRPVVSPLSARSRPRGFLRSKAPPPSRSSRASQTGLASWYGPRFHGRLTANGEVYNQFGMTAAHKTLPFGARVRVTNLKTGQSIQVRINDRGPHARGRIIDLSYAAARRVGVYKRGVASVQIEVLSPIASANSS